MPDAVLLSDNMSHTFYGIAAPLRLRYPPMERGHLARKLKGFDYFTLSFGTMVGAGWLVVMDDWLDRGGPVGAMLGFALGGLLLVPIAHVYGKLVAMIPDASSEVAYASRAFGTPAGFATGWMMTLAYLIVCPWEAVAIGKLVAYLFPAMNSIPLYHIAGKPIFLPHLALGLLTTGALTFINFRGIHPTAELQNWATIGFFILCAVFAVMGAGHGSLANFSPSFHHAGWISILLVLQIVPYFMTGFEAVPKCAEESIPGFPPQRFGRAIFTALFTGAAFYVAVIAMVAFVSPWRDLLGKRFATAIAFQQATGSRWLVNLILAAALVSLLKVFNGNFVAASRLLFGLGRAGMVHPGLGSIHPRTQTPWIAILAAGVFTSVTASLGDTLLVSITEVGSLASAIGWFASCASYSRLSSGARERAIAVTGLLVALALASLKLLPWVPGHFTGDEYLAMAVWIALGLALRVLRGQAVAAGSAASSTP